MHTYQPDNTAQLKKVDHAQRTLQLLCLIAQTLHRIEVKLDAGITPQQRPNKLIAF